MKPSTMWRYIHISSYVFYHIPAYMSLLRKTSETISPLQIPWNRLLQYCQQ